MSLLENPEFVRLRRTKLRARNIVTLGVVATLVYGIIFASIYWSPNFYSNPNQRHIVFFFFVTGIQLGVGSLYALMLASQNITMERERHTYDFQRLVAMGPWKLAVGKLTGCAVEAWLMTAVGAIFALFPVLAGAIAPTIFVQAEVTIILTMITVICFGLMASSVVTKTSHASGLTILFVVFGLFLTGWGVSKYGGRFWAAGNPVRVLRELEGVAETPSNMLPTFSLFGFSMPLMLSFAIVSVFAATFFFVIVVRRMTDEELSFLRLKHAAILISIFQVLLVGSLWDDYRLHTIPPPPVFYSPSGTPTPVTRTVPPGTGGSFATNAVGAFHQWNVFLMLVLPFLLAPSSELIRGRLSRARPNEHWKVFFEPSNVMQDSPPVLIILGFGALYAIASFVVGYYTDTLTVPAFAMLLMTAAIGMAVTSLLLYLQVCTEKAGLKTGGIIVGALLLIPSIFVASATRHEKLMFVNPFWYVENFAASPTFERFTSGHVGGIGAVWTLPIIFVVAATLLSLLVAMRMRFVLDMDEVERQNQAARKDQVQDKAIAAARTLAALAAAKPVETGEPKTGTEG